MKKLIYILLTVVISTFFIACSDDTSSSSDTKDVEFTIVKAPISDSTLVSTFQMLSLEFSVPIDPNTVAYTSVYIVDSSGTSIDSELIIDITNTKVTIKPFLYLQSATTYSFVVTTDVKSATGLSLSIPYTYVFTTLADSLDPGGQISFVSSNPKVESTADINTDIKIGFDRFVAPSDNQLIKVSTGGIEVAGSEEYFNSVVTFKPSVPLTTSTEYNISIIGSPTDMYGNSFNTSSYDGAFGFQTGEVALDSDIWNEDINVIDIGHEGYLIRTVSFTDVEFDYLAVAREGGVDFYDTSTIPFTKVDYSLPISSKITDKKYTWASNGDNLLISTMSDGVYWVRFSNTTLTDSNDFEVVRYLETEMGIYGVDIGLNSSDILDKIYVVGPNMGLKVLNIDENGDLSSTDSIAIDGSPLKVVSYTGGIASPIRHLFVSDYEHGVWSFDENGTSQVDTNITSSANHIFKTNDTLNDLVYSLTAVGNTEYINAVTPADASAGGSMLSYVNDVSSFTLSQSLISMPDKGVVIYNADYNSLSNENILKPSSGHPVSATMANDSIITILTKEGKLYIFVPVEPQV